MGAIEGTCDLCGGKLDKDDGEICDSCYLEYADYEPPEDEGEDKSE